MGTMNILDETYSSKVTAEFGARESAETFIAKVKADPGLQQTRAELVVPGDQRMGQKLEPESRGIARTAAKSHLILGVAFLLLGLVVAGLLVNLGPTLMRSSPVMTFIALGIVFPLVGLMLAGAITMRPDHDPMIDSTRHAAGSGRWTVVVHCRHTEDKQRIKELVDHRAQTL